MGDFFVCNDQDCDYHHCAICHDDKMEYQYKFIFNYSIYKGYRLSYGYLIRFIWRLSAILSRFIIFALIWVVLGGMIGVILIPCLIVTWYTLGFCAASWGNIVTEKRIEHNNNMEISSDTESTLIEVSTTSVIENNAHDPNSDDLIKDSLSLLGEMDNSSSLTNVEKRKLSRDTKDEEKNNADISGCCICFLCILGFFGLITMGLVFQLGIVLLTGRRLYVLRMIENFILMIVITVFAFMEFECEHCTHSEQRAAMNNARIFIWIVTGWVSVIIHAISSCFIPTFIHAQWDLDVSSMAQKFHQRNGLRWVWNWGFFTPDIHEYEQRPY